MYVGIATLLLTFVYLFVNDLSGNTTDDFFINALTGDLFSRRRLDRELTDVHHLTVAAVDVGQPALTSFATVTVHVVDDNDHPPQFDVSESLLFLSLLNTD